jgi:hypothetical protein
MASSTVTVYRIIEKQIVFVDSHRKRKMCVYFRHTVVILFMFSRKTDTYFIFFIINNNNTNFGCIFLENRMLNVAWLKGDDKNIYLSCKQQTSNKENTRQEHGRV